VSIFQLGDERPISGGDNAAQSDDAAATQQGTEARKDIKADLALVESIRRALQEHGYKPVLVCTGGKKPTHKNWQKGSPDARLYPPHPRALNTGILAGDLLALDIDCDDPSIASLIKAAAQRHLGVAPCRGRSNSPRGILLYLAARPDMRKMKIGPSGAGIEILAKGQQFVAYGLHESGVLYRWENDKGPHNTPMSALPAVTEAQIDAFSAEARSILAAHAPAAPVPATTHPIGKVVPLKPGACGRGADASILAGGPPTRSEQLRSDAKAVGVPDMNAAAQAGLKQSWFDPLGAEDQREAVRRCVAEVPNDEEANWDFYKYFGMVIYAATVQLPDGKVFGREMFDAWSVKNVGVHNDAMMDNTWREICSSPPTQLAPGTLLKLGHDAGAQLDDFKLKASNLVAAHTLPAGTNFLTVRKPARWNDLPHVMDVADAVTILNTRLVYALRYGGGPSCLMIMDNGLIQPVKVTELYTLLAPYNVRVQNAGKVTLQPAAKHWISSPARRTVTEVTYDPENKLAGQNILNTWRDFAVTPIKGRWRRIGWHLLHVICSGNKQYWKYLLRWLAHAVQYPGTSPEVMIVMRSDAEGTGKSTVGNIMVSIFGQHGHVANSLSEIFGEFNESIVNTSFLLLEENAFPGDHKQTNSIKAFITAHRLSINPKGQRRFTIPNMLHLMMCTNDSWAIPAGADARRFFMLDVTEKKDQSYFDALCAERDGGGLAAFLDALLKIDLRSFQPRLVPRTKALVIQQRRSADSLTQWLTDAVGTGVLMPFDPVTPKGGFEQRWTAAQLHATYRQWVRDQGAGRPMTAVEFGRQLGRLGFTKAKSNGLAAWDIPDRITVLNSADRRAGIQAVTP
jgi:hypothetical protein